MYQDGNGRGRKMEVKGERTAYAKAQKCKGEKKGMPLGNDM